MAAVIDLKQLAADVRQSRQEHDDELVEIDDLLRQTGAEIDRLMPERNDISRKLRELESNFEQMSRSDIRQMYSIAQESSMRLYMMQSRLEQLQFKQKVLQRSIASFDQALTAVASIAPAETEPVPAGPLSAPDLARAVIAGREVERRALARQLHAFTAQLLASLVMRAQICERTVEVDQARAREELTLLREALADRLQSTRLLIFELQPQVLDDLGLVPTIRRYLQLVERLGPAERGRPDPASGASAPAPSIDLTVLGLDRRFPHPVEIGAYRVVQEALRNALRYAKATRIAVGVEDRGDHLSVSVSDDGAGFDAAAALARARQETTGGLTDLLIEAGALDAALEVESEPGQGTRVRLTVPL
ncbi:MAG: sensor histidine kinase [Chloroflexota bacterium]